LGSQTPMKNSVATLLQKPQSGRHAMKMRFSSASSSPTPKNRSSLAVSV